MVKILLGAILLGGAGVAAYLLFGKKKETLVDVVKKEADKVLTPPKLGLKGEWGEVILRDPKGMYITLVLSPAGIYSPDGRLIGTISRQPGDSVKLNPGYTQKPYVEISPEKKEQIISQVALDTKIPFKWRVIGTQIKTTQNKNRTGKTYDKFTWYFPVYEVSPRMNSLPAPSIEHIWYENVDSQTLPSSYLVDHIDPQKSTEGRSFSSGDYFSQQYRNDVSAPISKIRDEWIGKAGTGFYSLREVRPQ